MTERSSLSLSRSCTSRPPITRRYSRSPGVTRRRSCESSTRVYLAASASITSGANPGACSTSTKRSASVPASDAGTGAVERDDAAVGRGRIGRVRALVGLLDRRAEADAARVAVLDDRTGRQAELLDQARCRVDVEQVVVRERLARVLRDHREQVAPGAGLVVVRRGLVRVLAVGEVRDLDEVHQQPLGQRIALGEPVRDRRVVRGGVREGLRCELLRVSSPTPPDSAISSSRKP